MRNAYRLWHDSATGEWWVMGRGGRIAYRSPYYLDAYSALQRLNGQPTARV